MKKAILFLLFFSTTLYCSSQELPNLKSIKLNKNSQFKGTEPLVLKVVAYLFETPIDKNNEARREAGQFLIKWMNGTPQYVFLLEEKDTDFFNTDADLMLIYMASFAKFSLENPSQQDQRNKVLGAMQMALPYLNKQENKKSWSKELWQLNDANQKGKLEQYLYN